MPGTIPDIASRSWLYVVGMASIEITRSVTANANAASVNASVRVIS